ncbi:MAG: DoxX family protein [Bacteroidales bacterium]|nr:DoxX family protein [Bacteroidales bacterium]MCF8403100.1 DoxX family protein [Bacteroidales bacterium]
MKIVFWIAQILLALLFLLAGGMKLFTPYSELAESMPWVADFTSIQIKLIASLEVLAAIGLILPAILKKYRIFIPLAALGLAFTMIGAAIVHIGRDESVIRNIAFFVLAIFVFYTRRHFLSKS